MNILTNTKRKRKQTKKIRVKHNLRQKELSQEVALSVSKSSLIEKVNLHQ